MVAETVQGGQGPPNFLRFNIVRVDQTIRTIKVFKCSPPKIFVHSAGAVMLGHLKPKVWRLQLRLLYTGPMVPTFMLWMQLWDIFECFYEIFWFFSQNNHFLGISPFFWEIRVTRSAPFKCSIPAVMHAQISQKMEKCPKNGYFD